jgi:hypothetical protein
MYSLLTGDLGRRGQRSLRPLRTGRPQRLQRLRHEEVVGGRRLARAPWMMASVRSSMESLCNLQTWIIQERDLREQMPFRSSDELRRIVAALPQQRRKALARVEHPCLHGAFRNVKDACDLID